MKTKILICALLTAMILTACAGSSTPAITATPINVSVLQTAAVQTVIANVTQTAAAQPTLEQPTAVPPTAVNTEASTQALETPTGSVPLTPEGTPTASLCDNSIFVSDASVPDGTQMTAGQAFVKSWRIKNTGTCTWTKGYQLVYGYGEKMGGLPTALSAEVLPGTEIEISLNLIAPTKTGTYGGYWKLANNNDVKFGQIFTVVISVP